MKPPREKSQQLRSALLRFLLLVAIVSAALFLFGDSELSALLTIERLSAAVDSVREIWWAPLGLVALWALMSPLGLPASPLVAAGGILYGIWLGTLYSSIGAALGAVTTWLFVRMLGRDLVIQLLGRERIGGLERKLENYGFKALIGIRFLPLPWPVVNFAAVLAGFRLGPFVLATIIGVTPVLFVYTLFFASLVEATTEQSFAHLMRFLAALAILAALALARFAYRRRQQGTIDPDTVGDESEGGSD